VAEHLSAEREPVALAVGVVGHSLHIAAARQQGKDAPYRRLSDSEAFGELAAVAAGDADCDRRRP
jgi:hypothetical protein